MHLPSLRCLPLTQSPLAVLPYPCTCNSVFFVPSAMTAHRLYSDYLCARSLCCASSPCTCSQAFHSGRQPLYLLSVGHLSDPPHPFSVFQRPPT